MVSGSVFTDGQILETGTGLQLPTDFNDLVGVECLVDGLGESDTHQRSARREVDRPTVDGVRQVRHVQDLVLLRVHLEHDVQCVKILRARLVLLSEERL